jgi:hypothetical protein
MSKEHSPLLPEQIERLGRIFTNNERLIVSGKAGAGHILDEEAAFVVRAVNNFEPLLEALISARSKLHGIMDVDGVDSRLADIYHSIAKAIAEASK